MKTPSDDDDGGGRFQNKSLVLFANSAMNLRPAVQATKNHSFWPHFQHHLAVYFFFPQKVAPFLHTIPHHITFHKIFHLAPINRPNLMTNYIYNFIFRQRILCQWSYRYGWYVCKWSGVYFRLSAIEQVCLCENWHLVKINRCTLRTHYTVIFWKNKHIFHRNSLHLLSQPMFFASNSFGFFILQFG